MQYKKTIHVVTINKKTQSFATKRDADRVMKVAQEFDIPATIVTEQKVYDLVEAPKKA